MRDVLMILLFTCSTLGSQLLIKGAVVRVAARNPAPAGLEWLLAVLMSPKLWAALLVQGLGMLLWLVVVSRVKLGPAVAMAGGFFYVLLAVVSWWLYGERLAPMQWVGIVLVSAGVLMMSTLGQQAV